MDLGLSGRRAVVCASTSGLGLACARALAAEGARVAITGRRGALARAEAAKLDGAIAVEIDLKEPQAALGLATELRDRLGGIDIVVLNSGGPPRSTAVTTSDEQMTAAVDLILMPAVRLVRLLVPDMQARGWGRVIAIGSSGVIQPIAGLATSNAARAALAGYLKTLASEVAAKGVTVNMVVPGRLLTDRVAGLDAARASESNLAVDAVRNESLASIPAGRYGDPMELGRAVAFLASDGAAFVNGSLLRVDGGMIASIS